MRKVLRAVIGIDESGRGPLAGPLLVAGIRARPGKKIARLLSGIRDSKQLSAKQREKWFAVLTGHPEIEWATAKISSGVIDRINIYQAAQRGAWRVYKKLKSRPPPPLLTKEGLRGG